MKIFIIRGLFSFIITSVFTKLGSVALGQITNSTSCDVEVTLWCSIDAGCDQGCSTTVCIPANSFIPFPAPCVSNCQWPFYQRAKVCLLDAASNCASQAYCNGTGSTADGCAGDCLEVGRNTCAGLSNVANGATCCCSPATMDVNWLGGTTMNIAN